MTAPTQESTSHEHSVQFYESSEFLISIIKNYFSQSEKGVIIARPEVRKEIEKGLRINGMSLREARMLGSYQFLDAQELLSKIMMKGLPHPQLFAKTMGVLMQNLTKNGQHVHVFGEMVSVLCEEGNTAGAMLLEELWNELQQQHHFSLLCAYPLHHFDEKSPTNRFSYICKCHTHVLPPESLHLEKKHLLLQKT